MSPENFSFFRFFNLIPSSWRKPREWLGARHFLFTSARREKQALEKKSATPHEQQRDVYKIFYTLHESEKGKKKWNEEKIENLWDCSGQFSWSCLKRRRKMFCLLAFSGERLFGEEIWSTRGERKMNWNRNWMEWKFFTSLSKLKNLLN